MGPRHQRHKKIQPLPHRFTMTQPTCAFHCESSTSTPPLLRRVLVLVQAPVRPGARICLSEHTEQQSMTTASRSADEMGLPQNSGPKESSGSMKQRPGAGCLFSSAVSSGLAARKGSACTLFMLGPWPHHLEKPEFQLPVNLFTASQ